MNLMRKPFRYTYSHAALCIIGINVLIYALEFLSRGRLLYYFALNPHAVLAGRYWQFITYMFVHDMRGWSHIIFNMLALFIFGTALERHTGSKEFVLYYLLTGALAGVLSFFVYVLTGTSPFLAGASGALFAVQLAYAAFFPHNYIYIWGILPLRAPVMVLVFTAIELFSGLFGIQSGTAHITHLFGFAAGTLYFFIRWGANPFKMMFSR